MSNNRGSRITRVPSDVPGRLRGGGRGSRGTVPSLPGGGAPLPAPSAPIAGGPRASAPVPWDVRPPGAREINIDASGTGFNAANTPQIIPGSVFTIPANNVGILRAVVLSVNNMLNTSLLLWRFRFDGNPVEGWANITIFPRTVGYAASSYGPNETWIFVPEGSTIDVQIDVLPGDANTYQAGVTYHGWSYSKRTAELFTGLYG